MIHLEDADRAESVQTVPVVGMPCEDPACANACRADAIKKTAHGVVQSSLQDFLSGCRSLPWSPGGLGPSCFLGSCWLILDISARRVS